MLFFVFSSAKPVLKKVNIKTSRIEKLKAIQEAVDLLKKQKKAERQLSAPIELIRQEVDDNG